MQAIKSMLHISQRFSFVASRPNITQKVAVVIVVISIHEYWILPDLVETFTLALISQTQRSQTTYTAEAHWPVFCHACSLPAGDDD